jgi:DNA-binding IclR family transcriptional regulator
MLKLLAREPAPVPAASLARELGLPRSTVYHLLSTLIGEGFVVHVPEDRRYALGVAAYELAWGYSRHEPVQRLARVPLAHLVDITGHSGHFAVLHGHEVVYVIEERARGRSALITDVGVRLPAQLTATGKSMLAALPRKHVRALFPDPGALPRRTAHGPRSYSELSTELQEVRRRGYAIERGEVTDGMHSVAVAVLDHAGHPVASVALTFGEGAAEPDSLAAAVRRTAAQIGRRLRPDPLR